MLMLVLVLVLVLVGIREMCWVGRCGKHARGNDMMDGRGGVSEGFLRGREGGVGGLRRRCCSQGL